MKEETKSLAGIREKALKKQKIAVERSQKLLGELLLENVRQARDDFLLNFRDHFIPKTVKIAEEYLTSLAKNTRQYLNGVNKTELRSIQRGCRNINDIANKLISETAKMFPGGKLPPFLEKSKPELSEFVATVIRKWGIATTVQGRKLPITTTAKEIAAKAHGNVSIKTVEAVMCRKKLT